MVSQSSYCPDRVAATDGETALDCNFEESCKLTPEQTLGAIQNTQNKKEQNFALQCRGKHQKQKCWDFLICLLFLLFCPSAPPPSPPQGSTELIWDLSTFLSQQLLWLFSFGSPLEHWILDFRYEIQHCYVVGAILNVEKLQDIVMPCAGCHAQLFWLE